MAAFSVAVASMLAGLLNPMWLSLIWKKLNEPAFAGLCVSAKAREVGTPPLNVHSSPVPAHAVHFRKLRRSTPSREAFFLLLSCAHIAVPFFVDAITLGN